MSQIRGKNTKPELLVRKFLFANGLRYKLHEKKLPGKPDIVFPKLKTVIFINGCFWHGHDNCKYFLIPGTRTEWWFNKIERNKQRDMENISKLKKDGWIVISVFECDLKRAKQIKTLTVLLNNLHIIMGRVKEE